MRNGMERVAGTGRAAATPAASEERRTIYMPLVTLVLCACLTALAPGSAPAAEPAAPAEQWPVTLGAGSELSIDGTSTLHPWTTRTDSVGFVFHVAPGTARPADARGLATLVRTQAVHGASVDVAVHKLRSKESKLDKNLWKAMRNDEFPNVHFELASYTLGAAHAGDTLSIRAQGTLTICGKEQKLELEALAHAGAGGLWLVGSKELLMSDYGIRPPTMMMGALRVGDRVQVHYRLLLVPGIAGVPATTANSDEKGAK